MTAKANPGYKLVVYTPADGVTFLATRGFIIEVDGPVSVTAEGDTSPVVIPRLIGGVIHPISITTFENTGTTATSVVLVY